MPAFPKADVIASLLLITSYQVARFIPRILSVAFRVVAGVVTVTVLVTTAVTVTVAVCVAAVPAEFVTVSV
jgi:hypothetical protein